MRISDWSSDVCSSYLNGCAHAIDSSAEDFVEQVKTLTDGKGVSIVFDSVGKDTFEGSLNCLARFGLMVSYGWASGDVEPVSLPALRNMRSEEHTSELQSLMRISYAVFCLQKNTRKITYK